MSTSVTQPVPTGLRAASQHPHHALHPDRTPVERVADILRKRALETPDNAAFLAGGVRTTFAELDRRSSQLGHALRAAGVGAGDRVAFVGGNGPAFLEVVNGAGRVGALATAVNNKLAPAEVAAILADAEPTVLVLGKGDAGLAPQPAQMPSLAAVVSVDGADATLDYDDWLAAQPTEDPGFRADPHEPSVLLYTSGTTGRPKGIMLSGDNIGQALATMHYEIPFTTESVAMAPIPYFHVAGFGLAMVAHLGGATLLLDLATDVDRLVELMIGQGVTHAALVPTVLQAILNSPAGRTADWSALQYVVYGASPIPLPVIRQATAVMGCHFLQSYGLTESTGGVTMLRPGDHLPAQEHERRLQSAGTPLFGVPIRVVDPVTLEDCALQEHGEVLIGGGHVMKGYWRLPEETDSVMLEGGWLRTGDGGSFDEDGYLYLHDRLKDMIITGGENVFPAEVESVLTAHPAIAEVAVVGVPSTRWGESPYAVVVLRPGERLDEQELMDWARERLAIFKCPVGMSVVPTLARNASGKLMKARMRTELAEAEAAPGSRPSGGGSAAVRPPPP